MYSPNKSSPMYFQSQQNIRKTNLRPDHTISVKLPLGRFAHLLPTAHTTLFFSLNMIYTNLLKIAYSRVRNFQYSERLRRKKLEVHCTSDNSRFTLFYLCVCKKTVAISWTVRRRDQFTWWFAFVSCTFHMHFHYPFVATEWWDHNSDFHKLKGTIPSSRHFKGSMRNFATEKVHFKINDTLIPGEQYSQEVKFI